MNLLNLSKLSSEEILKGSFGIEWESLRAKGEGKLSLTPHHNHDNKSKYIMVLTVLKHQYT